MLKMGAINFEGYHKQLFWGAGNVKGGYTLHTRLVWGVLEMQMGVICLLVFYAVQMLGCCKQKMLKNSINLTSWWVSNWWKVFLACVWLFWHCVLVKNYGEKLRNYNFLHNGFKCGIWNFAVFFKMSMFYERNFIPAWSRYI